MPFRNVFPSAAPLTKEAKGKGLAAFLFGNVPSQRLAHQCGHGNTLAARQCMELLIHGFFQEKCGASHMTYSSIRWIKGAVPEGNLPEGDL